MTAAKVQRGCCSCIHCIPPTFVSEDEGEHGEHQRVQLLHELERHMADCIATTYGISSRMIRAFLLLLLDKQCHVRDVTMNSKASPGQAVLTVALLALVLALRKYVCACGCQHATAMLVPSVACAETVALLVQALQLQIGSFS